MIPDLLSETIREPAECLIQVDGIEIVDLYPYLTEVTVETGRAEAWTATLRLESRRDENGRWSVQDAGVLAPWKEIVIEAAFGARTERVMSGYVREVDADYPEDPSSTTVRVQCQDRSLALDRTHERTVWGGDEPTDDSTIVRSVLSRHGLRLHPESGPGLSGLVVNQDGTDVQLLRDRAEANGYELIVADDTVYFGPMRVDADPQATILVYAGPDTHCYRFDVRADGHQPDRVVVDLASAQGAERVERVVEPDLSLMGTEPADSGGAGLSDFAWRMTRQGKSSEEELLARAQGKANELAMKLRAEGELDGSLYGHVLEVGRPVGVDGVGDWLGGTYYVDRVTHRFSVDGYRQGFRLLRNAYGDNLQALGSVLAGVL